MAGFGLVEWWGVCSLGVCRGNGWVSGSSVEQRLLCRDFLGEGCVRAMHGGEALLSSRRRVIMYVVCGPLALTRAESRQNWDL